MTNELFRDLHADPWNDKLVDLASLNERASSTIESAALSINRHALESPHSLRSESLVFLGPPGAGKTHLFSRLRKKLGPRAIFVHIRPLLHGGLTPAFVLNEAVMQLAHASYGHSQADALVGSLVGHTMETGTAFPSAHLSELKELSESKRGAQLEFTVERVLDTFADVDDVFLERLLQLPFASTRVRRALLAWLAGQDCDPSQLQRIGASTSMGTEHAVRALRTLGSVAALGSPLVVVFDQLENLIQRDQEEARITQYGHLIAELVDATRGLLIVQMALDSEWEQGIEPRLNLSQRSRVVMKKSSVTLPSPAQHKQLLEIWYNELSAPLAPFPWPFEKNDLESLVQLPGLTPRMLLSAFNDACVGSPIGLLRTTTDSSQVTISEVIEILMDEWETRIVSAHLTLDQVEARRGAIDANRLCDGILTAAEFSKTLALSSTQDSHIQIEAKKGHGRWLSILHQSHHRSIGAVLDRVLARPGQLPGLVLREKWRSFPPTWKSTLDKQLEILERNSITWFELSRQDAAALLALEGLVQAARSHDLCDALGRAIAEETVRAFIRDEIRPEKWSLLKEIARINESSPSSEQERVGVLAPEQAERGNEKKPSPDPQAKAGSPQANHSLEIQLSAILQRLRVASVDRLIREARRVEPDSGRSHVIEALASLGPSLHWHGRNIVSLGDDS